MPVTFRLEGFAALDAKLRELNADMQKKIVYKACLAGANVIKAEAVVRARAQGLKLSGALINNIAVAREKSARGSSAEYHIGVRHGKRAKGAVRTLKRRGTKVSVKYTNDPFYWWFHENGAPGRNIPARPFIRPAFESKKEACIAKMRDVIKMNLDKYGRKD